MSPRTDPQPSECHPGCDICKTLNDAAFYHEKEHPDVAPRTDPQSMSADTRTDPLRDYLATEVDPATALADLRDAVEIMDQKITPYGEREDGTVQMYIVADSTWHRILAVARGSTSDAARKAIDGYRAARPSEAAILAILDDAEERDEDTIITARRLAALPVREDEPGIQPINVERLAEAMKAARAGQTWTPTAFDIAAEYDRLSRESQP